MDGWTLRAVMKEPRYIPKSRKNFRPYRFIILKCTNILKWIQNPIKSGLRGCVGLCTGWRLVCMIWWDQQWISHLISRRVPLHAQPCQRVSHCSDWRPCEQIEKKCMCVPTQTEYQHGPESAHTPSSCLVISSVPNCSLVRLDQCFPCSSCPRLTWVDEKQCSFVQNQIFADGWFCVLKAVKHGQKYQFTWSQSVLHFGTSFSMFVQTLVALCLYDFCMSVLSFYCICIVLSPYCTGLSSGVSWCDVCRTPSKTSCYNSRGLSYEQ